MAKAEIKLPEEFLLKVSKLEDRTDEIIPGVLEAGAEVVLAKVKSNLSAVIGKNTKLKSRATGELQDALGVSPVLQDDAGNFNIKVGFKEPRSDGGSNAKLANILEYGKAGQPPKPFLKPAKAQSRDACIKAMKQQLESEMEKI
ncbi:MAG: HK97-gp10 family putative phage morphogenesis protein [Saccharofermentanales bacterium]